MINKEQENKTEKANLLAQKALNNSDYTGWFDVLYSQAEKDHNKIPWATMSAHPYLKKWLEKNQISGENKTALVIGCGLGDDAETIAEIGFKVTAFDISPSAIAWCKQRFPDSSVNYIIADLFNLDSAWEQKFDFVFECRTIQSLPLEVRVQVIESTAKLVANNGNLLIITHLRETEEEPSGPPWALSLKEIDLFKQFGLKEIHSEKFFEGENNDKLRLIIEYKKT
jgi:2-polyprenyl-3-methyl-5-hydroxy-6-metoxy-1,4-benzoquinol methylase